MRKAIFKKRDKTKKCIFLIENKLTNDIIKIYIHLIYYYFI
jgi:hypothetical protein